MAMATSSALVVEGGVRELRKGRLPEEILSDTEGTEDHPRSHRSPYMHRSPS